MTIQAKQVLDKIKQIAIATEIPIVCDATSDFLIGTIKPNSSILEIGTAIGYSGILMLANSDNTNLTTIEIRKDRAEIARQNFIKADLIYRVEIVADDALEFINENNKKFDFIFLDGAMHRYPYMYDGLKKALNKSGTIFVDNALGLNRAKKKCSDKLMSKMDEFATLLNEDKDFKTTLYNIGDGVLIAQFNC